MNNQYFENCIEELTRIEKTLEELLDSPDKETIIDISGLNKQEYGSLKKREIDNQIDYADIFNFLEMCDENNIHATLELDYHYS
ncbi:hypothetical protein GKR13_09195 [Staphylococcus aureus]|uniref:hypothetical protein n=1 Tax=Staphylococcus aureus TaxID=1280 RepID=UPI001443410F|nr:hypothetical protein [Staphylococcus aureus]NKP83780.1 hypothetical protein [Staphylococcus aureus]HDJ7348116.1 hypothetical protein [Staphylococcus aureus]